MKLSHRIQQVQPSSTLAITARANEIKAQGHQIIGLGAGEPDFDTPDFIKQAAIDAINQGFTKYTAVGGIPNLKQAIVNKFKTENQLDYTPEQILVSCGGKQSFYNLAQSLLDAGDEVIIPVPYWVSYPAMVQLADATPVYIETTQAQQFKITAEQLEQAITPNTRLFVLNSPSNPSGMSYTETELKALAEALLPHPQIMIATDDMYEHIIWQGKFINIVNVCPELYERTIVLNGVSKAYAMTGWRIGYAAGDAPLIKAMTKLQSHSTSNPTSISQIAALTGLESDNQFMQTMVTAFKQRHDYMVDALNQIDGVDCQATDGTFYIFPEVQGLIKQIDGVTDDLSLVEYFITEAKVALIPGSAFGCKNHVRISIATGLEALQQAIAQIQAVLQ